MLEHITPIILTYNEDLNIGRTLDNLAWAKRIVVVDSFSNDRTIAILKQYPQVEIFQRKFDCHNAQWNYALEQAKTEWVLSLDADYLISDELIGEIKNIPFNVEENGFWIPLRFCIDGIPLKCSILPPRIAFFRKDKGVYSQQGHTQILMLGGKAGFLTGSIQHDDRKPFNRWIAGQKKYADQETEKLIQTPYKKLNLVDKLRRLLLLPIFMPVYILLFKGSIFDGRRGIYYTYLRTYYEVVLAVKVLKRTIQRILV